MSREPGKTPDTNYYGGYYYGEGGAGYADNAFTPSRSFKDYLIILRERIWWLVAVAFILDDGRDDEFHRHAPRALVAGSVAAVPYRVGQGLVERHGRPAEIKIL